MGEDCAGAVQFVRDERLDAVLRSAGRIEPLTERDIGDALKRIRRNAPPWRAQDGAAGMFSLAGAQGKLALARVEDGWGRPEGKAASTHIIKPPMNPQLPGVEVNEHICLNLARHLGIPAAASRVARFDGEVAIVVERFDRVMDSTGVRRLHQEDTCQALAIPPSGKYQRDGGPGFIEMAGLARTHSADPQADLRLIVDAAAFNWLIGGTDAHAKNYSWFITTGDRIRMTPLYDLISSLPWHDIADDDLRNAMSIGGENRFLRIRRDEWSAWAEAMGADPDDLVSHVRELAELLPVALETVLAAAADEGLDADVLEALRAELTRHAGRCAALL
ncbi:MAG: HipA domain-containing protein, partial [Longimicrobiales bacterium]